LKFKDALENYINISKFCYKSINDFIKYLRNFVNSSLCLLIKEEYNFFSLSGRFLEEIVNFPNEFAKKEEVLIDNDFEYNPWDYIKSREIFRRLNKDFEINEDNLLDLSKFEEKKILSTKSNLPTHNKMFLENFDNIKLNSYIPKILEKSKSTNDISRSLLSIINQEKLKNKNKFNYEKYNIDKFIERKSPHFDEGDPETNELAKLNNNIPDDMITKNNNFNKKFKIFPIKLPKSPINHQSNQNYKTSLNEFTTKDNKNLIQTNRLSENMYELKTKETVVSNNAESSYKSSSLQSDEINDEYKDHKKIKINYTQEKICKNFKKSLINHEDYLKRYIFDNLLHDGKKGGAEEKGSLNYQTPEIIREFSIGKKYEPKIITKEKIENYYKDSLLEKFKINSIFGENNNNKINLKISNSHINDHSTRFSLMKDKNQESSKEEENEVKLKNTNITQLNSQVDFEHQNKSKFHHINGLFYYDQIENKENLKNVNNVDLINLPISINNRNTNKNKIKKCKNTHGSSSTNKDKNEEKETQNNKNSFEEQKKKINYKEKVIFEDINIKLEKQKIKSVDSLENQIIEASQSLDIENQIKIIERKVELNIDENSDKQFNEIQPEREIHLTVEKFNENKSGELGDYLKNFEKINHEKFPNSCSEYAKFKCWEEVFLPKQLSESIKKELLVKQKRNHEKSGEGFDSCASIFSSDFEDKRKLKNNYKKNKSNGNISIRDGDKYCTKGKSQFENFYEDMFEKESDNNGIIIYDVFNGKIEGNIDFLEDYYSENNLANNFEKNDIPKIIQENEIIKNNSFNIKVDDLVGKIKQGANKKSINNNGNLLN